MLLVLFAWAVLDIARIGLDARSARAGILRLDPGKLAGPRGVGFTTAQAERRLRHADRLAHRSLPLRLTAAVPIARDQVGTVRDATDRAHDLALIAARTGTDLQRQVDVGTAGSANRLALIEVLARSTDRAAKEVAALPPVRARRYALPPATWGRRLVVDQQADAGSKLGDAARQAEALRGLLRGPRRILVLAANNAEMLSGGGLVGSIAVAEVADGAVKLGPFSQSSDLVLFKTGPVPLTRNQANLWEPMGFGFDFRGVTSPSSFELAGATAAAMAERAGLGKVDGVVLVDVLGLQQLLGVTGPVQVEDVTVDVHNAADQLLYQNYLRFSELGGAVRSQRAELQGRVGQAVFQALDDRPTDLGRLFDALRFDVAGRHLMGWSADPEEELLWQRAKAAGELDTEGLQISLVNRSGNKLDYHLRPVVAVSSRPAPDKGRRVKLEISTANLPRSPTSPAVEGTVPQQHYCDLVAYLPQNAVDIKTDGAAFSRSGEDGGMRVVVKPLFLNLGAVVTVTIEFTIPADQPIRVIPSARAAPIPYVVKGKKPVFDVA
ncbi:MAG: DUF4012 domain-containing protein, partial [Acidimicrobiales bacterium]